MTPKQLGYRMPAEWEPHQATWLSWPHKEESWPGKFDRILPVYAQMVAALAESEPVHINVNDAVMEHQARDLLLRAGARGEISFHEFPTNDAWCRDHGAVFITRDVGAETESPLAAVDFQFNSWGNKYPPFDLDNQIPHRMADALDVSRFACDMVLEGGSIDVNGQGLLLTTEACLLNSNRNPELTRKDIEQRLCDFLGVACVLWLGDGIVGDDTDGHIDDLARFVAPNVIVTALEDTPNDGNYAALKSNFNRLKTTRNLEARPFEIVTLPMPPAVICEGYRLPATYANFYIANSVVLVPGYHTSTDEVARRTLQELFPDRQVIQIDCTDLVWGLGAFHCLTQQVPSVPDLAVPGEE